MAVARGRWVAAAAREIPAEVPAPVEALPPPGGILAETRGMSVEGGEEPVKAVV